MSKATHTGTCQACGARQKLPGGVLSTHGYTVDHGFFNGTCLGSEALPYELSKDLIDESIAQARSQAAHYDQIAQSAMCLDLDGNEGWHHCYMRELSSRSRGSVRMWKFGKFSQDGFRVSFICDGDGTTAKTHGQIRNVIEQGRDNYIAHMKRLKSEALAYIEHQRRRIADWKPRPDALVKV